MKFYRNLQVKNHISDKNLKCPQCGAQIKLIGGSGFVVCPYCDSTLYVDLSKAIEHFYYPLEIKREVLEKILSRWLIKHELPHTPDISASRLTYIPFWRITKGSKSLFLPAASLAMQDLNEMHIPRGDFRHFDPSLLKKEAFIPPDIYLDVVLETNKKFLDTEEEETCIFLIHVPMYTIKYIYQKKGYEIIIDGIEGRVMADNTPPSPQLRMNWYFSIALIFTLGVFTTAFYLIPGFLLPLIVSLLSAIPFYFILDHLLLKRKW